MIGKIVVPPLPISQPEMVSRRKILSRSRDDLNVDLTQLKRTEVEEDVWYDKEKLFNEHIQEVLDKWRQIDDEIWAKVIVFERNRRVAKAYARAPVLTVNGSDDGFDGMRIGLCGFDNPMRDQKTDELKRHIGQGVKIKMDDAGNILVRRYSKCNVYVKSTVISPNEETSIGSEVLKSSNQSIEHDKVVKIFDMAKFQSNLNRELSRAYPDRRRLETQCLLALSFVKSENDILDCPIWIMIVNVVAMDMLKSKLPPAQRPVDIKNRPKIPIPDEDPYSLVSGNGGGSSGSSGLEVGRVAATRQHLLLQSQQQVSHKRSDKPPKLPPRDNLYPQVLKPDYDDAEEENRVNLFSYTRSDKGKDNKNYDDPYYCGMRARVPNFVKSRKVNKVSDKITNSYISSKELNKLMKEQQKIRPFRAEASFSNYQEIRGKSNKQQHHNFPIHDHQYGMWQSKSHESGINSQESPYKIYGKMPLPTRGYVPTPRKYIGGWD